MNQRPFWAFLPYINNRTAWRPVSFPAILIIPFGANDRGYPLAESAPHSVNVSILDAKKRNRVSGPFTQGVFFPSRELFTISLNSTELASRRLDIGDFVISQDPIKGDILTIVNSAGIIGDVPYIQNSLYYDLSDIAISVENLQSGRYQLNYQAMVYKRIYDDSNYLVCIDSNASDAIIKCIDFAHPGEVIDEMKKTTPSVWFSNTSLAEEPLMIVYKPLSDSLQNVYDEQSLLSRINFVNSIFPETVPYLGRILGWEIPYFPSSLDPMRRSMLRTTTEFQKKRGTFKGITELFDLFGFDILIRNLWTAIDNKTLLEPRYDGVNGITLIDSPIVDVLVADLRAPGFYDNTIQLLRRPATRSEFDNFVRPGSEITLEAYAVTVGSPAQSAIDAHLTQFNLSIPADLHLSSSGFVNKDLVTLLSGQDIWATQTVHLDTKGNVIATTQTGNRSILHTDSITIDSIGPSVSIKLDGHWADESKAIYIFAYYNTQNAVPDPAFIERRSNYFDIKLYTAVDTSTATNLILDYAIEFLYRIKAMHSLLRHVFLTADVPETYLVTDYCYGPGLSRQSDSDIGKQQVPPAILPLDTTVDGCSQQDTAAIGYKASDIAYRDRITSGLVQEWISWTSYDDRPAVTAELLQLLKMIPQIPNENRMLGNYNEYGQDAYINVYQVIESTGIITPSPLAGQNVQSVPTQYVLYNTSPLENINNRCVGFRHSDILQYYSQYTPAPDLQVREPICFKGRVNDELAIHSRSSNAEWYMFSGCRTHMGTGVYYTTPRQSTIVRNGAINRLIGSKTPKPIISSDREMSGEIFDDMWKGRQGRVGVNPLRLIGNTNDVLHYSDRPGTPDSTWNSAAIQITNLGIQYTNMHFPGTRFISMANSTTTFVSNNYHMRPWDIDPCDGNLNAVLTYHTDGNQYLQFTNTPFGFIGNGYPADIPTMGDNTSSPINNMLVVHAIWSKFADENDDDLCPWDTNVNNNDGLIGLPPIEDGAPTFRSAVTCQDGLIDYADGHPCMIGLQNVTPDFGDSPYYDPDAPAIAEDFLFFLNSGIKDGSNGLRMDCDCLIAPCDATSPFDTCTDAIFDTDSVTVTPIVVLNEMAGIEEWLMDGSIPSMLELIEI